LNPQTWFDILSLDGVLTSAATQQRGGTAVVFALQPDGPEFKSQISNLPGDIRGVTFRISHGKATNQRAGFSVEV
jgi:hypothetical protein